MPEWNVETNTKYLGPRLESMENINYSSFFLMPHSFIWSTNYLNLVKKSWIISNWVRFKVIYLFSSWCSLSSSVFPNSDSRLSHTSFGVVRLSTWNKIYLEIMRQIISNASSNLLKYLDFSTIEFESFYVPMVTL